MLFIKEISIICLLYYWLATVCMAEEVKIKVRPCNKGKERDAKSEVHEVSIGPCPTGGTCELYKGHNATITVKFTPSELPSDPSGCKLKSKLVWLSKINMDFGGISSNACQYMDCPLEVGKEAVFKATFFVSKMWPTGSYPLKLRVHENAGDKRVFLCQLLKVRLTGQPAEIQVQ